MTTFGDALANLTVRGVAATIAAHDRCCDCGERFGEREYRGRCLIHPNEPHHMMPCAKYETADKHHDCDNDPEDCQMCPRCYVATGNTDGCDRKCEHADRWCNEACVGQCCEDRP